MGFTLYLPLPDFHYTRTMDKPDQPWKQNPLLRMSYSLYAPIYDLTIERAMRHARQTSLAALPTDAPKRVLISGVGTGLDLPHLPELHHYTALDFNPAMLSHAIPRGERLGAAFVLGDSMSLPFADASFDHVVLHLIVAVVPEPQRCLAEAARVLKPGGTVLLFDKFLREGQHAPLRRLVNLLSSHFVTRTDVVLEAVLRAAPELVIASDEPALGGNWQYLLRHAVPERVGDSLREQFAVALEDAFQRHHHRHRETLPSPAFIKDGLAKVFLQHLGAPKFADLLADIGKTLQDQ